MTKSLTGTQWSSPQKCEIISSCESPNAHKPRKEDEYVRQVKELSKETALPITVKEITLEGLGIIERVGAGGAIGKWRQEEQPGSRSYRRLHPWLGRDRYMKPISILILGLMPRMLKAWRPRRYVSFSPYPPTPHQPQGSLPSFLQNPIVLDLSNPKRQILLQNLSQRRANTSTTPRQQWATRPTSYALQAHSQP